jgi:hypothetical protein
VECATNLAFSAFFPVITFIITQQRTYLLVQLFSQLVSYLIKELEFFGSGFFGLGTGSVADPDPGSGAFLTPGSGIRNRFFPDPGSLTHIFESILKIFWVKTSTIL